MCLKINKTLSLFKVVLPLLVFLILIPITGKSFDSDFYTPLRYYHKKRCCNQKKRIRWAPCNTMMCTINHRLNIAPVRQKKNNPLHSSSSCISMVFRYYKIPSYSVESLQNNLEAGEEHISVKDTNIKVIRILKDKGFRIVVVNPVVSNKDSSVTKERIDYLLSFVVNRIPVLITLEEQYLLVTGINGKQKLLYVNDPADGTRKKISLPFLTKKNEMLYREQFREITFDWDGSFIAVWK